MKILKRKILLTLSLPIDFFKQKEGFDYKPYSFVYFLLSDYQKGSIRDAIHQLVRSGEVDKIIRDRQPLFRLTAIGRERLLSFFPIAVGQKKVWDRRWRLVVTSLPLIKQKLRKLGFKRLARAVYLTPMPVSNKLQDFFLDKNLLGKVFFCETRRILAGDDQNLAKNVWKLEQISQNYQIFIKECGRLLKRIKGEKGLEIEEEKQVALLFNHYFLLLSDDPGLPKKLLMSDWPADLARDKFLSIFQHDVL